MEDHKQRKAAFLDRDGTLVEEVNFLSNVEDLRVFPFTLEAIRRLKDAGFLVIVVTNQSGIGRGIYDEKEMNAIHDAMQSQLDGMIDAFYFCPHLPCDGCLCRKPKLGMIESAMRDFSIDLAGSWMIGDKKIDIETGRSAGTRTAMVMTGYGRTHAKQLNDATPDVLAENLLDAVREALR
jgi:D-glycero-D-manno-heptose 1,7-bisphosphate phosphatase